MKKKRKKRKIKLFRLFIFLIIICILTLGIYFLVQLPVRGFYISGNTYYTDQEILQKTHLDKYPSYLLTSSFSVSLKVKNDSLIKSIKIKKTLKGMFEVIVNENKILFYDEISKKSILDNNKESNFIYEYSPVLVNVIEDKKLYNKFISKISKIDDDVLKNISEIKYDPNDIDNERFLMSMNDGNYVYVTLSKFSNINKYLEISKSLGEKKGVLYLDYGNYFVPKD